MPRTLVTDCRKEGGRMRVETAHVIGKDEYRGGGTRPEDEQQRRAAPHLAPNRVGGPSGQDANVRLSVGQSKLVCSLRFGWRLRAACCGPQQTKRCECTKRCKCTRDWMTLLLRDVDLYQIDHMAAEPTQGPHHSCSSSSY